MAAVTARAREVVAAATSPKSRKSKGKSHKSSRRSGKSGKDGDVARSRPRSIGRWYIGETLGKGGYSWVKKGYDKRTSKCVALKFMAKADSSWEDEQTKQVVTEIESLKKIRHPNVMKLYAYNLNAKYPTKDRKEKVESILLVLEFAPGGELFDILYYTSALETIVARTYFRQFMAGLEACHAAGVAHRDLKPQNLLLDAKFNLKITDFGLSKVFQSDADTIMKTTYVGTRGYQAPELLLNRPYDLSCDIFSAGVVLFILLTGYPPFEQAHKNDRWFRPLAKRDYKKFWDLHNECTISSDESVKDLLTKMLTYDPKKRITLAEIKEHAWYNGKYLEGKDLIKKLMGRHRDMERKRRKDARKLKDLAYSIKKRAINPVFDSLPAAPMFPVGEVETVHCTHTVSTPREVFGTIEEAVSKSHGRTEVDLASHALTCYVKLAAEAQRSVSVKILVQMFQSREFVKPVESDDSDSEEDEDVKEKETVYVVRLRRLEGEPLDFRRVSKHVIFDLCASVLTGLPKWARSQEKRTVKGLGPLKALPVVDVVEEDDYDALLVGEGTGF